jgi:hypothetical protein
MALLLALQLASVFSPALAGEMPAADSAMPDCATGHAEADDGCDCCPPGGVSTADCAAYCLGASASAPIVAARPIPVPASANTVPPPSRFAPRHYTPANPPPIS